MNLRRSFWVVTGLVSACSLGCSGSGTEAIGGSGSAAVGGNSSQGGMADIGGSSALGGTTNAGGSSSSPIGPTGGGVSTGGAQSNGGGVSTGGARSTGGGVSTGGAQSTGGMLATGGVKATGGKAATGGGKATGGANPAGGSIATGGAATGGAVVTGGSGATGGSRPTGGTRSTGGTSAAGGATAAGGTAGTGGTCVPNYACTPTAPNTGDIYADCAARVNQFRACVCLGPLTRNTAAEACLDQEAAYDASVTTAHAAFQLSPALCTPRGNAQNECPGWSGWNSTTRVISQCIQQMFNEGPPPTNPCTGSCYSTYGHYINMTNNTYKQVACGFYTSASGQVTAVQNFFP